MGIMLKPVTFAELSTLIYFSRDATRYLSSIESEFKTFDLDTELAYFRITPRKVVIVFRGSCSMLDWTYNLKFWMVPFDLVDDDGIKIHYGMNQKIQAAFDFLINKINPNDTVYFAGHSLGGALSLIAAYAVKVNIGAKIAGVYVFGTPPVGNDCWAKAYNCNKDLKNVTHDFMIKTDWVNFLPLKCFGYKAVGLPTHYLVTRSYFPTAIHAHLPWAYCCALKGFKLANANKKN